MNSVVDFDGFPAFRRCFISRQAKQRRQRSVAVVSERLVGGICGGVPEWRDPQTHSDLSDV